MEGFTESTTVIVNEHVDILRAESVTVIRSILSFRICISQDKSV